MQINISWEFVPLDSLSPLNGNKGRVTQDGGFWDFQQWGLCGTPLIKTVKVYVCVSLSELSQLSKCGLTKMPLAPIRWLVWTNLERRRKVVAGPNDNISNLATFHPWVDRPVPLGLFDSAFTTCIEVISSQWRVLSRTPNFKMLIRRKDLQTRKSKVQFFCFAVDLLSHSPVSPSTTRVHDAYAWKHCLLGFALRGHLVW